MIEQTATIQAIALIALVVYLTRVGGYFIGQQIRHISGLQPVLEALPGCAMMAILIPAIRQGDLMDTVSLVVVVALMWKTGNVVISSLAGMSILLFGHHLLS